MSDKRSKKRKRHPLKAFFKFILILLLVVLVIVGAYIAYVFIDYHRLPDHQQLDVKDGASLEAKTGETYKIISFNTGFGAYEPDYSFFMDGGTQSWAWSKERLTANVDNIKSFVEAQNADIVVMQEVDEDATRTYHVNERKTYEDAFSDFDTCFAQNWDSPFLFYPVQQPHGKTVTGILTLSSFDMQSAERRSVPVEDSVMKIVDLDRCYSKSYLTVEGGKTLVLYNLHLSAYTSDGTIADKQLDMLLDDMNEEYENGSYIIAGGDFNKELLGDSSEYFGISGEQYSWAKPIKMESFEGKPFKLVAASNVPSNRNADAPYNPDQFVNVLDGFVVSDNVEVVSNTNIDIQFAYSDHNPVEMEFKLN